VVDVNINISLRAVDAKVNEVSEGNSWKAVRRAVLVSGAAGRTSSVNAVCETPPITTVASGLRTGTDRDLQRVNSEWCSRFR
jgi:hypothetical protein